MVLKPGQKVVVVDDLISTGGSVLNAVRAIDNTGAQVVGVVAVFTYQLQAAEQNFLANDLKYFAVTDYTTLIEEAKASNQISTDHLKSLQQWRQDPVKWSNDHKLNAVG